MSEICVTPLENEINGNKFSEKKRGSKISNVPWTWMLIFILGLLSVYQSYTNNRNENPSNEITPRRHLSISPQSKQRKLLTSATLQNGDDTKRRLVSLAPGWKPVYVYYGTEKLEFHDTKRWHGQKYQDEMVMKILENKENGYFIDLASNDAVGLSNTYALERDFNWNGLCIEMNDNYWYGLAKRKCDVVGALVGRDNDEEMTVVLAKKHLGGIEFGGSKRRDRTTRRTASLKEVFKLFNVPKNIDYLSLDVEGAEEFIMEAFPIQDYQFSLLTVERPSDKLVRLLRSNGYTLVHYLSDWGETLWVHNSLGARDIMLKHSLNPKNPEEKP